MNFDGLLLKMTAENNVTNIAMDKITPAIVLQPSAPAPVHVSSPRVNAANKQTVTGTAHTGKSPGPPDPIDMMNDDMSEKEMLRLIWQKVTKIDTIERKVDSYLENVNKVETRVEKLEANFAELERGVSYMEQDLEQVKTDCEAMKETKADLSEFMALKMKVVDLGNRSRRNNIVLHNVPEGSEGDKEFDLSKFVESFIQEKLGMGDDIQIGSAHRTPMGRPRRDQDSPRIIHARCIKRKDRDRILREAPEKLRDSEYEGSKVFITDDIEPHTREVHKKLVPIVQEMRHQGNFAYIPFSVPRVIKYREGPKGTKGPMKTYRLPDTVSDTRYEY